MEKIVVSTIFRNVESFADLREFRRNQYKVKYADLVFRTYSTGHGRKRLIIIEDVPYIYVGYADDKAEFAEVVTSFLNRNVFLNFTKF